MTITAEWLMGIMSALAVGGIVGLVKHAISDGATRQRIDDMERHTTEQLLMLRQSIASGILPRTDERIKSHDREIEALRSQIEELKNREK